MAMGTTYTTQDFDPQKGSIIEEFSYKSGKKLSIFSSLEFLMMHAKPYPTTPSAKTRDSF